MKGHCYRLEFITKTRFAMPVFAFSPAVSPFLPSLHLALFYMPIYLSIPFFIHSCSAPLSFCFASSVIFLFFSPCGSSFFCILWLCIWEWEGSLWFLYIERPNSLFCILLIACLVVFVITEVGTYLIRTDLAASDWIFKIPSGITQNFKELVAFVLNKIEPNCCINETFSLCRKLIVLE